MSNYNAQGDPPSYESVIQGDQNKKFTSVGGDTAGKVQLLMRS